MITYKERQKLEKLKEAKKQAAFKLSNFESSPYLQGELVKASARLKEYEDQLAGRHHGSQKQLL